MNCHQGEFGIPVILEKRWEVEEIIGEKKKEKESNSIIFFFLISLLESSGPMQTTQDLLDLCLLIKCKS